MATFQGGRFLEHQLRSISEQSHPPDEVVICDDRSNDATSSIVDRFSSTWPRRLTFSVNEERLGSSRNFERAISLCTGDIIALADQDDVWRSDKLERLHAALSGPRRPGLAFSDGDLVDEQLQPLGTSNWQSVRLTAGQVRAMTDGRAFSTLVDRQAEFGGTVVGSTMAFLATYRDLVLPFPSLMPVSGKGLIHDAWIALLVAAVAEVAVVPDRLVRHRQHTEQQIGLRRTNPGPPARAASAQRSSSGSGASPAHVYQAQWCRALLERLQGQQAIYSSGEAISSLSARVRHLEARAAMPAAPIRRLGPVARELVGFRYHAYSSGLGSAVRDLLR